MDNANSPEYLEKIKVQVIENLKRTAFAPSVQMTDVPRDPEGLDDEADAMLDDEDEDEHKDQRWTKRRWDKYVEKEGELSESEDEEENERNGVRPQAGTRKRRNMMDYQNLSGGLNEDDDTGSGAISEKRGRSRERNGDAPRSAPNGSARSSAIDGEGTGLSNEASDDDADEDDEDIEMADDNNNNNDTATTQTNGTAPRPQEATPPDSPPSVAAAPTAPADIATDTGNDAMDEGDLAKDEGREERELEDAAAENSTEAAERREES